MDLQKLPLQAENPAEKSQPRVQLARENYQHWEIKLRTLEPPNYGDTVSYSLGIYMYLSHHLVGLMIQARRSTPIIAQ